MSSTHSAGWFACAAVSTVYNVSAARVMAFHVNCLEGSQPQVDM
jgi:hypothetical protein